MKALRLAAALCFSSSAHALTVEVKNIADGSPATSIGFGSVDAKHQNHHSARQYLEVAQSGSRFRKVYLYTDNGGAFGVEKAGMVIPGLPDVAGVPFFWRAFDQPPPPSFTPGEAGLWKLFLEKSRPEFSAPGALDARARLPDGGGRVALGLLTQPAIEGGDYQARIVLEEVSDVADVTGPSIAHDPFYDVFILGIPLGLKNAVEDDGTVTGSTVYFRLEGQSTFTARPMALTADPDNPFRWKAEAHLEPSEVSPGALEYYFAAADAFDNETKTEIFRANLLAAGDEVSRPMSAAGGRLEIAVGDPALPGLLLDFPAGSLAADQTITVTAKPVHELPDFRSQAALGAFDFGPSGLHFGRPVTLSIPYLDRDQDGFLDGSGLNERELKVFWFDGLEWRYQGGAVDAEANRVRAAITHFSVYGIFAFAQALSADVVRPLEKIITPNGDGQNDFCTFNISGDFEVEFFTLRGERIRRLTNINTWDGRDEDGDIVETGTYVYKLNGQGVKLSGMIAVAR